jgi:hypothetical protein
VSTVLPVNLEDCPGLDQKPVTYTEAPMGSCQWKPSGADLQRGRTAMLRAFSHPHNLPLIQFSRQANKSRHTIVRDVAARRLLALKVGARGLRIPDWQLDATCLKLTRTLMASAPEIDGWTWVSALTTVRDKWDGKTALEVVRPSNLNKTALTVLRALGFD